MKSDQELLEEAIEQIKDTYCVEHLGIPYLLLGDVYEVLRQVITVNMDYKTFKNEITKNDKK
jgi:hypothetical protein